MLEKDLNVLDEGVINGRKTFANTIKYIMMAASGNFGNIISIIIASIFLPFLPLLPIHILIQNLLNNIAQIGMPFDNVDDDYIMEPKKWDIDNIKKFMFIFGPISTIFDVCCFAFLWFILGYNSLETANLFQTGWFAFGVISQTMIIHMIRTDKVPFIESMPSKKLLLSTAIIAVITLLISCTPIASILQMSTLPLGYQIGLIVLILAYFAFVHIYKAIYVKKNKKWL